MTPLQILSKTIGEHPEVLIPFGNYCVVEIFEASDVSAGGVALPDQVKERANRVLGRVIRAGVGLRSNWTGENMGMFVKEGDLVLITKHAAAEVRLETGEVIRVVAEGDILGKIDEERLKEFLPGGFELNASVDESEAAPEEDGVERYQGASVTQTEGGIFVVKSE